MQDEVHRRAYGDRMLGWAAVRSITGVSRTTARRMQKTGDFPETVWLSPGRVGWRERDVEAWIASRSPRTATLAGPMPTSGSQTETMENATHPTPPVREPIRRRRRPTTPLAAGQIGFEF